MLLGSLSGLVVVAGRVAVAGHTVVGAAILLAWLAVATKWALRFESEEPPGTITASTWVPELTFHTFFAGRAANPRTGPHSPPTREAGYHGRRRGRRTGRDLVTDEAAGFALACGLFPALASAWVVAMQSAVPDVLADASTSGQGPIGTGMFAGLCVGLVFYAISPSFPDARSRQLGRPGSTWAHGVHLPVDPRRVWRRGLVVAFVRWTAISATMAIASAWRSSWLPTDTFWVAVVVFATLTLSGAALTALSLVPSDERRAVLGAPIGVHGVLQVLVVLIALSVFESGWEARRAALIPAIACSVAWSAWVLWRSRTRWQPHPTPNAANPVSL